MHIFTRFRILIGVFVVLGVAFSGIFIFGLPTSAEALSTVWKGSLRKQNIRLPNGFPARRAEIDNIRGTVKYSTRAFNIRSGRTYGRNISVTEGDRIAFRFNAHRNRDISWFITGLVWGSPYGTWRNGASRDSRLCAIPSNRIGSKGVYSYNDDSGRSELEKIWYLYAHYYVDPPSKRITGLGGNRCSGTSNGGLNCTMTKPGTYTVRMRFNSTAGRIWLGIASDNKRSCQGAVARAMNVPTRDIIYRVTVKAKPPQNKAPSTPVLSHGACVIDETWSLSMRSTDANNDTVRYHIDWNPNSAADQITGWNKSGTTVTAKRTYGTEGSKEVRVRAEDRKGTFSGWRKTSFTCTDSQEDVEEDSPEEDDISGDISGVVLSGGSFPDGALSPPADLTLSVIPSLVQSGQTTKVNWSVTNVNSCTVTGENGDSWSGENSPVGGETSLPITARVVYTLSCQDLNDVEKSETATVNVVPVFQEI